MRLRILLTVIVISMLCLPRQAYAYIDPGSGSSLFQLVLFALFGFGYAIRSRFSFLKKKPSQKAALPKDHEPRQQSTDR